jgi:hypothetical protein
MAIEIVDFPINSMVIKQTKVYWLVVKKTILKNMRIRQWEG